MCAYRTWIKFCVHALNVNFNIDVSKVLCDDIVNMKASVEIL